MDAATDAADYDAMDHAAVNATFAADFLSMHRNGGRLLDVGTGTAQIPIELARRDARLHITAIDLADEMLHLAARNIEAAGFTERIRALKADASGLNFESHSFDAVLSNSIIHHIPEPHGCFAEMVRVGRGTFFVRDLLRPDSQHELDHLVQIYAAGANPHQRQLFADSLQAALTLDEVRALVVALGFPAETVQATSDRHWTWCVTPS